MMFEEWYWSKEGVRQDIGTVAAKMAWDYQQAKIDKLENELSAVWDALPDCVSWEYDEEAGEVFAT